MKKVVVRAFGGPHTLEMVEEPAPAPAADEVLVRLTSIGMNHADLMARRGEYKLSSGEPPFTPGIEGGGIIEAVGAGVTDREVGQRVILGVDAPRERNEHGGAEGTYRTHFVAPAARTVPAPAASVLSDELLGTLWLPYLTAWGALVWKQDLRPGQFVALPAASSSVALAAAQIVKQSGAIAIGLTTSSFKAAQLRALPESDYAHVVVTRGDKGEPTAWHRELRSITGGHGVDVFFDPVAAGPFLDTEIRSLAQHGTIWIYGLLDRPGPVDVSPLIRKHGALRGWLLHELAEAGEATLQEGYRAILEGFAQGALRQTVARVFALDNVQDAHIALEEGAHIGKMILVP